VNNLKSPNNCWLLVLLLFCLSSRCEEIVSFRNDVMAVLSKAGCNAGPCHGNANGKAGFKLSLRGESADLDYLALTRDQFGRRINLSEAEQSLILLKPTTQLAHEGGQRFKTNSWEFEALINWIKQGLQTIWQQRPHCSVWKLRPWKRRFWPRPTKCRFPRARSSRMEASAM
jgi:hypothetical protein